MFSKEIAELMYQQLKDRFTGFELFKLCAIETSWRESGVNFRVQALNLPLSTMLTILEEVETIQHDHTRKFWGDETNLYSLKGSVWLDTNKLPLLRFEGIGSFSDRSKKIYMNALEKGREVKTNLAFTIGLSWDGCPSEQRW